MAFKKGQGGRKKGSLNKKSYIPEEIADKYELAPLDVLMMIAMGDWEGLGYATKSKISYSGAGIEFEEDHIKLSDRLGAAKEVSKYLYSAKQSVQVSGGDTGIKIVVCDYLSKEEK